MELDVSFYDAYISALVKAGKFRRAHQIYFHMTKRKKLAATANTYLNLITIYGESKRWDLVQRYNDQQSVFCVELILHPHCRVHKKMLRRGIAPDSSHHSAAILAVAKVVCPFKHNAEDRYYNLSYYRPKA